MPSKVHLCSCASDALLQCVTVAVSDQVVVTFELQSFSIHETLIKSQEKIGPWPLSFHHIKQLLY